MKNRYMKIDSNLVHQTSEEDVLIYNGYVGLPCAISSKTYNAILNSDFNDIESEAFHRLYTVHEGFIHPALGDSCYILNTILPMIKIKPTDQISGDLHKILNEFYVLKNSTYFLNVEFIDENNEKMLLKKFKYNDFVINEYDRIFLAKALERIKFYLNNQVYYCTMFNDTNHSYYYKKEHEHVPGMMVIEAVRQAFYAYTYTFNKCKRGNVSISISTLNSNFYKYAQSNYPLKIMVENNLSENEDSKRILKLKATLFQRNSMVAEIFYQGDIMRLDIFKRLRVMGKEEESYVFHPIRDEYNTIVLINNNLSYICKIKEISTKGMRLLASLGCEIDLNSRFRFVLSVKNNKKIIADCIIDSYESGERFIYLQAKFADLTKESIMNISDYIKNYTYIVDEGMVM